MANQFTRQFGQTAGDFAKKVAKQMVGEPLELMKNTKKQVVTPEVGKAEEVRSRVMEQSELLPKVDEQAVKSADLKRIGELEAEVRNLIGQREKQREEWRKRIEEQMALGQKNQQDSKELIQPTTKRKSGFMGMVKGKQGTKEVGKAMSG